MKHKTSPITDLETLQQNLTSLWPALKGSLALVHKPCIRPGCRACANGKKHPAHLLAFMERGRRRCMYVPNALVPKIEQALENGRRIEALLYQAGPAILTAYRQNRPTNIPPKSSVSSTKSRASKKSPKSKS